MGKCEDNGPVIKLIAMGMPHRFRKSRHAADVGRATPALRVLISGFDLQRLVTAEEVVSAVDQLPAFHLEHLREISYEPLPKSYLPFLVGHGGRGSFRNGEYIQRNRKIVLYHFDCRELFYRVLFHEIGHHVFFLIMNSKVKKRWVTELHRAALCVTPYATYDAAEDFAESYAAFVIDPVALKYIPEKYDYMRYEVFSALTSTPKEADISNDL